MKRCKAMPGDNRLSWAVQFAGLRRRLTARVRLHCFPLPVLRLVRLFH